MNGADYPFYLNVYLRGDQAAALPEPVFNRLAERAEEYIEQMTGGKSARELSGAAALQIRKACCALADAMYLQGCGGGIAGESTDGYSVSYVAGISNTKTEEQRYYAIVQRYLSGTGLLYRGI